MLQNPSKYHPNPLSHFLALHNSANNHNHHYQQSVINNHQLNGTTINGNGMVNTSLDVGKSFTIAAILGLQKNAIEQHQQNHHRDFNSVMNLSLNGHNNQKNNNNNFDIINNCVNNNSNNNSCNTNINNSNNNNNNSNNSSGLNNFDCDSVNSVVNRYLPNTNGNNGHLRVTANHFGAVAVGNKVNRPSALQSLQQLHQQHAQQQAAAAAASLGYQRDKIKDHLSSKKSSLKNKRVRTIFTPEQLERLEAEFERQQYMVGPERLYLAHTLQLTEAQVKVWFQNRRIKWRKHHLEITQQRLALIRQTNISNGGDEDIGGVGDGATRSSSCIINNNDGSDLVGNIMMAQDILSTNNTNSPLLMTPINHHHNNNNNNQSESDLSICNDSMDGESIVDGDDT